MSNAQQDLLPLLRVGEAAVLSLSPQSKLAPRHRTTIRGWHAGSHIIVDRPIVRERHVRLEKGEVCVLRFLTEGKACGFDSQIVDFDIRPERPSCTLMWPRTFELVSFRRHERVPLFLPCTARIGDEVLDGEIQDISLNGCRVRFDRRIHADANIPISFELPAGFVMDDLNVIVRNQQCAGNVVVLGCEFDENQEHLVSDIAFFVASSLERGNPDRKAARRVFIVDANSASSQAMRALFEDNGWQAFVAGSSVEGLLRLRMLPPTVLLINEAQEDLVTIGVLRLIKSSKGLDHLRIFVYRGKNAELRDKAAEAGLAGYFEEGEPYLSVSSAIIASVAGTHD